MWKTFLGIVKDLWPVIFVIVAVLLAAMSIRSCDDGKAIEAKSEIEQADAAFIPEQALAPSRVQRASRGVRNQVEVEVDTAMARTPEDPAGPTGDVVRGHRSDDAWRSGIERLRDPASRY